VPIDYTVVSEGKTTMRVLGCIADLSQPIAAGVDRGAKLPLLQIAGRQSRGRLTGTAKISAIRSSAQTALQLLDNYAIGRAFGAASPAVRPRGDSHLICLYDTVRS